MIIQRFISILFLFILLAFQSSCTSTRNEEEIYIGFSQCISSDQWRKDMNHSMMVQTSLYPNINLKISEANRSIEKQIAQIEDFIEEDVDVLLVSPLETKKIVPIIERAYEKGIPVILIDRKIDSDKYTAFVGADNIAVGRMAASYIASSAADNISVLEIKGTDNSSPTIERSLGFNQIAREVDNIESVFTIENYTDEQFSRILDTLDVSKTDYVFSFNDILARSAWQVAENKGLADDLKFVGVDGLVGPDGGINMVLDGRLQATVLYPTGGAEAIKLARRVYAGEQVPKNNSLNITLIDKLNADIMKNQYEKINEQQLELEKQLQAIEQQEEKYYVQNNLLKIAMALLAVILSLAIYSIYSIRIIRRKNKELQLTNEKVVNQRNKIKSIAEEIKRVNKAKINFFTGISHEFKTPLTLIMSSLESIYMDLKGHKSRHQSDLDVISRNSKRLLRLINNLLDFRRIEDEKFNLKVSKTNLLEFSEKVSMDFKKEAKKRSISFEISSNDKDLNVYIDRNLMDKVYFNLLSNAFKFTPDNGSIKIHLDHQENKNIVNIHFKDSGIGIPENEKGQLFKPFFKAANNNKKSSGIGLNITKQFVELHKGNIEVNSHQGTEFVISLPTTKDQFSSDQIISTVDNEQPIYFDDDFELEENNDLIPASEEGDQDQYSILIIEDNYDLSRFLNNKLGKKYRTHLSDGSDALEKAFVHIPDIIICDINLPDKDGFEICETLKKDLRTSHIPTIILTALGDRESYLKGLESGADLYLTKPFSFAILLQSLKSLLYNREKLRYYYTNNLFKLEKENKFSNSEQEFISRLNNLIKEHLDHSDFTVEKLAEELNVSRVQLYRKVKALLGTNISDYINNYKLENAKRYIENTDLSVSEIAYKCGFSTPNYFSTSFKNKYGASPASYRKSYNESN